MIRITSPIDTSSKPYTEGLVGDALKAAADVDVNQIKDDWKNADKVLDKARVINDDGLSKAADSIAGINKTISRTKVDNKSIIARSRNSVLQFPVYVTQTLRVNEAQIIAKLFERVYTTLVQTVLSQNPILDESEANNLVFLKRFHTNIKESADLVLLNEYYKPIDEIDTMMQESVFYSEQINPRCFVEFRIVRPDTEMNLIKENARLLNEPLQGLSYLREAGTEVASDKGITQYSTVTEEELEKMARERAGLSEREWKTIDMSAADIRSEVEASIPDRQRGQKDRDPDPDRRRRVNDAVNRRLKQKAEAEAKFKKALDDLKKDIKDGKVDGYSYDGVRYRRKDNRREITKGPKKAPEVIKSVDAPKLLRDADIKKINGLLPYTIEASFRLRSQSGGLERDVHFIIGIKTVMHLIRTQDLAEDLRELVTGNIKSLQKVRYKTGEISFMDYMFNVKGIKSDAAKHINYNKRWINTLKRLGEYDKLHGSLLKEPVKAITGGKVPIPNGTLILSQTDVTTLTNQTGIDLSTVSNAKRLAKTLFLIGVVIVDSSAGSMRVLFPDSDTDWDVQSLAAIDAEISKTDNSQIMREINRIVNK